MCENHCDKHADRTLALKKVEKGMKYYRELLAWKINGGKQ
jgi:hypothetical protein